MHSEREKRVRLQDDSLGSIEALLKNLHIPIPAQYRYPSQKGYCVLLFFVLLRRISYTRMQKKGEVYCARLLLSGSNVDQTRLIAAALLIRNKWTSSVRMTNKREKRKGASK